MFRTVLLAMLISLLLIGPAFSASYAVDTEFIEGVTLIGLVERSAIVVLGTVVKTNYVTRPEISHEGATTDIILRIDNLIKGEPNMGDDHVIFMIEGGVYYSTYARKNVQMIFSDQPKFEEGEQCLIFLGKFEPYADYAHGGLHLIHGEFSKKEIDDNKVRFWYLQSKDTPITVLLELDLVIKLAKAYVIDNESAKKVEAEIKTLALNNTSAPIVGAIGLSDDLKAKLLKQSKEIINRKKGK